MSAAMRWGEPCGEAISSAQAAELTRLAKERFGERWESEFRYWLTCRGYYVIIDLDTQCPKYSGTTRVVPVGAYEELRKELEL